VSFGKVGKWGCFWLWELNPSVLLLGESIKKGASHAKVKVLSKDFIFHVVVFYMFILHFSHDFFN
jgi:hypothetical protein